LETQQDKWVAARLPFGLNEASVTSTVFQENALGENNDISTISEKSEEQIDWIFDMGFPE